MQETELTIAGVARGAEVGVETVRYYERRGLVPQPARAMGSIRRYGRAHVDRIRFIKRAQELGFTLEEIATLLKLEDGTDRRSIRRIATARLNEIINKINDLKNIERALSHLLHECESNRAAPRCPIIGAITGSGQHPAHTVPRRS